MNYEFQSTTGTRFCQINLAKICQSCPIDMPVNKPHICLTFLVKKPIGMQRTSLRIAQASEKIYYENKPIKLLMKRNFVVHVFIALHG